MQIQSKIEIGAQFASKSTGDYVTFFQSHRQCGNVYQTLVSMKRLKAVDKNTIL